MTKKAIIAYAKPAMSFIDRYWKEHNKPPTIREVADAINCNSTSQVREVVELLKSEEYKYLKEVEDRNTSRMIIPLWVSSLISRSRPT